MKKKNGMRETDLKEMGQEQEPVVPSRTGRLINRRTRDPKLFVVVVVLPVFLTADKRQINLTQFK